jgi:hypothetical protein
MAASTSTSPCLRPQRRRPEESIVSAAVSTAGWRSRSILKRDLIDPAVRANTDIETPAMTVMADVPHPDQSRLASEELVLRRYQGDAAPVYLLQGADKAAGRSTLLSR